MDLEFSEEQNLLRDTVARLCEDHCQSDDLREMESSEKGFSEVFWQALGDLGVNGLRVEEQYQGIGLGWLECATVHEEMGRSLAPSPHFVSSVLSTELLSLAGSDEQKESWLPALASGEKILVPAWQEAGVGAGTEGLRMQIRRSGEQLRLSGEKLLLPFANSADGFIVLAKEGAELRAVLVPAQQVLLRAQPNHADQNLYAIELLDVQLPADALLPKPDLAVHWDQVMLRGQIALAAQAVGGAAAMLDMAVSYSREREQFGQPIGAFQSIAHYLADCATEIEGARYLVYQAAWACDQRLPFTQLALMAKLQATAVFRRVTVKGVQIHGGMGFSAEADPQLYYRRAKHLQLMHWDPRYIEQRVAEEVFS